jgi:hypothetical protein
MIISLWSDFYLLWITHSVSFAIPCKSYLLALHRMKSSQQKSAFESMMAEVADSDESDSDVDSKPQPKRSSSAAASAITAAANAANLNVKSSATSGTATRTSNSSIQDKHLNVTFCSTEIETPE